MSKVIDAVYEDGVFKPLTKPDLPEHKKLTLIIPDAVKKTRKKKGALEGIIDIAQMCADTDLSVDHDKYLYGER